MPLTGFRRLVLGLFGLVAYFGLASCTTVDPKPRLADFVEELIFGGAYDAGLVRAKRVRRWDGDIVFDVAGPDSETHRQAILEVSRTMAELSGLNFRPVEDGEEATLMVRLTDKSVFEFRDELFDCYTDVTSSRGRIVAAEVVIGMAGADSPRFCLAHELMHAFGFGNHSAIVRSSLSPMHDEPDLTPWDRLALLVLYDVRLKRGMPPSLARPVIDELIAEKLREI